MFARPMDREVYDEFESTAHGVIAYCRQSGGTRSGDDMSFTIHFPIRRNGSSPSCALEFMVDIAHA